MSATAAPATSTETQDDPAHVDKRLDPHRRLLVGSLGDAAGFDRIPFDVTLFLLPDDDRAFVEHELAAGAATARRGRNVFFRHVTAAELAE